MRRGFKTLAERNSIAARNELLLEPIDPLDPWAYAAHLRVMLLEFGSLELTAGTITQLTAKDSEGWSAMTLKDQQHYAIVLNPGHALTRQRSNLMHELAHIQLAHTPSRVEVSKSGLMLLADYSEDQEQEADWHGAALLVPREGLMQMRASGTSVGEIANFYGVSEVLCAWRLRMTAVDVQLRRSRAR